MKKITAILLALAAFTVINLQAQKFDGLALTPQMGWNSWNKFQGRVSEQLIRETADAMATNGMKDAGYQYVNIDDLWQGERNTNGNITADATRFPSGIKALADYVHSKGLKLGIYSDAGTKTCGGRPGSRDHELQDAQTYAAWGIDYLKYDWCNVNGLKAPEAYKKMSDALRTAGRPILFSLCEWGNSQPWTWAKDIGQSWRTTGDITACFDCVKDHGSYSDYGVLSILDKQVNLRQYAGPGHWNDPDMLEVGNGMSVNEDRAHFTLWCMLCAPLISGNDLRHMNPETLAILTDRDILALNQDALGVQAFRYSTNDSVEVWFKPLSDGAWAMCVLNRNPAPHAFSFDWKNEKVSDDLSKREANFAATTYALRNLWTKQSAGTTKEVLSAEIPGHDVLVLRLKNSDSASAPAAAQKIIRIKAGASAPLTDEEGNVWEADHGFADGDAAERATDMAVANTKTPSLYRSERYGMTAFSLPLANGNYTVKLHFAETYDALDTAGSRVFSYTVAGHEFKNFDVFAKSGGLAHAYVESVPVEITDGKLNITFTANVENPEINGIEIIPTQP